MARIDCPDCDTTGMWGSDGKCSTCHGTGKDNILQQALAGAFGDDAPCDTCNGTGDCQTCNGEKTIEGDEEEE